MHSLNIIRRVNDDAVAAAIARGARERKAKAHEAEWRKAKEDSCRERDSLPADFTVIPIHA